MLIKKITAGMAMMMISFSMLFAQSTPIMVEKNVPAQDAMRMDTQLEYIRWEDTGFPTMTESPLNIQYILLYDVDLPNREDKTYAANELDKMPLFSKACAMAQNPSECSENEMQAYFEENLEYPEDALSKNQDGVEKVMFTLNKQGEIEGNIKLISKDKPCDGCAQAAVDAVADMPAWRPGMVDGKPVKSKVILPIKFKTITR